MLLGVDVGGTFTDAGVAVGDRLVTAKSPTTPEDQSEGVLAAVRAALERAGASAEEVRAFVTAYSKRFNSIPDGNAALAYDATKLLAHAVEQVGPDRAKIREYLANLSESIAFHGVTGAIRFRADGDPIGKGIVMTRVHDGAMQVEAAK